MTQTIQTIQAEIFSGIDHSGGENQRSRKNARSDISSNWPSLRLRRICSRRAGKSKAWKKGERSGSPAKSLRVFFGGVGLSGGKETNVCETNKSRGGLNDSPWFFPWRTWAFRRGKNQGSRNKQTQQQFGRFALVISPAYLSSQPEKNDICETNQQSAILADSPWLFPGRVGHSGRKEPEFATKMYKVSVRQFRLGYFSSGLYQSSGKKSLRKTDGRSAILADSPSLSPGRRGCAGTKKATFAKNGQSGVFADSPCLFLWRT